MKRHNTPRDEFRLRPDSEIWEWAKNPKITIRPRVNASGGLGFRVTFPKSVTGGPVVFIQSKDLENAKELALKKGAEFVQSRSTALILSDAEKIQAASALKALESSGISTPLDEITRRFCEAHGALRSLGLSVTEGADLLAFCLKAAAPTGKPLVEIVNYAVERLCPAGGTKTLSFVIEEMVKAKKAWAEQGQLRPASIRDFIDRTRRISNDLGAMPLPEITKGMLIEWLKGLNLSPRSKKNYRMVLSEVLRYAHQMRYCAANPVEELTSFEVKDIEGQKADPREPKILTPSQARALITTAFAKPELDLGPAVVLGLFCGIRTEELKRLRWDAVRLREDEPFVVIGPEIAKKRKIRNVTIPPCAVAWLSIWQRRNEDGGITRSAHANDYQKRFKKLARFAKVEWDQNAMRHSFGSYHFALHANAMETARLMGHRGDDSVLFSHYRALATKSQGEEWFDILPPKASGNLISFPKRTAG